MIQRVQTLFLAGATIISVMLFFVPFSEKSSGKVHSVELTKHILVLNPMDESVTIENEPIQIKNHVNYILLILNLLILSATAYTVFIYQNRMAQMKLCALATLMSVAMLALVFYFSDKLPGESNPYYGSGVYLVAVQVFLILAARRAIRKDEMMVRAAERIR